MPWCGTSRIMVQVLRPAWRRNGGQRWSEQWRYWCHRCGSMDEPVWLWTFCDKHPGDRPPAPRRPYRITNTPARPPPRSTIISSSEQCRRSCSSYCFICWPGDGGCSSGVRERTAQAVAEHPIVVHGRERDGRTVYRSRVRVRQSEHHRELSISTVLV